MAVLDLGGDEGAAAADALGVGVAIVLGDEEILQRPPEAAILGGGDAGLGRGGFVRVDLDEVAADARLGDEALDGGVRLGAAVEHGGDGA